jgi:hypothetical protein
MANKKRLQWQQERDPSIFLAERYRYRAEAGPGEYCIDPLHTPTGGFAGYLLTWKPSRESTQEEWFRFGQFATVEAAHEAAEKHDPY